LPDGGAPSVKVLLARPPQAHKPIAKQAAAPVRFMT
jgi:hypothetical protein